MDKSEMTTLLLIGLLVYLLYKWSTSTFDFFEKQGIPFRKPLPLVGNNGSMFLKSVSILDNLDAWYKEFPNEK